VGPRIFSLSSKWPWGTAVCPADLFLRYPLVGPGAEMEGVQNYRLLPLQRIEFLYLGCVVSRRVTIVTEKAGRLFKFYYVVFQLRSKQ